MAKKTKVVETDKGWAALKRTLARIPDKELAVGIPGAIDLNARPLSVGSIGTVHEFGSLDGTIPERSFLRSTFDANVRKYTRSLSQQIRRAIERNAPQEAALFRLGEKVRQDVIDRIRNREIKQGIKESTKKAFIATGSQTRRGDGPALVNTGRLVDSIVSVVRDS